MIGDAGFRLSVMATAGLLAWANPLTARLATGRRRPAARLARGEPRDLARGPGRDAPRRPRDVRPAVARLAGRQPRRRPAGAGGDARRRRRDARGRSQRCSARRRPSPTLAGLPGWVVLHVIVTIVRVAAAAAVRGGDAATRRRRSRRRSSPASRSSPRPSRGPVVVRRLDVARSQNRGGGCDDGPRGRVRRRGSHGHPAALAVAVAALASPAPVAALERCGRRATRITVLDVGQGDAILLETRTGARMLIDGGPDPDRMLLALDARIPPWDRRLDVVVLTHPHEDHVAGLPGCSRATRSDACTSRGCEARVPAGRSGTRSCATGRRAPASRRAPSSVSARSGSASSGPIPAPCRSSRPTPAPGSTTCRSCSSARPTGAASC